MPFMPAVRLNQLRCALLKRGSAFWLGFFLRFASSFFCFRPVLQFNLLAPFNVCCPNASGVFGARFKLLSDWSRGAPNMVIYAMSKSGTATSGLI
jgi:hypothetical protein